MDQDATYSLLQAAKRIGTTKSTVRAWVQSGRLAAERTPDGHYLIHESALLVAAAPTDPRGRPRRGYPRP